MTAPIMKALIPLAFLITASCSTYPTDYRSRTVFGRIVSTQQVEIWLGHVTGGGMVYEVAFEHSPRTLIGLMTMPPYGQCPYNGRPREQLFRIEYAVAGDQAVYGPEDRDTSLPRHLMTSLFVLRCEPAAAR